MLTGFLLTIGEDLKVRTSHLSSTYWRVLSCLGCLVCVKSVNRGADCIRAKLQKDPAYSWYRLEEVSVCEGLMLSREEGGNVRRNGRFSLCLW